MIEVGTIDKPEWIEAKRRIYSPNGVCPTLNGVGQGGNTEPKIIVLGNYMSSNHDASRIVDINGIAQL